MIATILFSFALTLYGALLLRVLWYSKDTLRCNHTGIGQWKCELCCSALGSAAVRCLHTASDWKRIAPGRAPSTWGPCAACPVEPQSVSDRNFHPQYEPVRKDGRLCHDCPLQHARQHVGPGKKYQMRPGPAAFVMAMQAANDRSPSVSNEIERIRNVRKNPTYVFETFDDYTAHGHATLPGSKAVLSAPKVTLSTLTVQRPEIVITATGAGRTGKSSILECVAAMLAGYGCTVINHAEAMGAGQGGANLDRIGRKWKLLKVSFEGNEPLFANIAAMLDDHGVGIDWATADFERLRGPETEALCRQARMQGVPWKVALFEVDPNIQARRAEHDRLGF